MDTRSSSCIILLLRTFPRGPSRARLRRARTPRKPTVTTDHLSTLSQGPPQHAPQPPACAAHPLPGSTSRPCWFAPPVFAPPVFCITCVLHHLCFASPVFCTTCVLHHLCFASHVFCITCVLHYLCFASPVFCITCVLHHLCFASPLLEGLLTYGLTDLPGTYQLVQEGSPY